MVFLNKRFWFWLLLLVPVAITTSSYILIHIVILLGPGALLAYFASANSTGLRHFTWALNLSLVVGITGYPCWTKLGWSNYVYNFIS